MIQQTNKQKLKYTEVLLLLLLLLFLITFIQGIYNYTPKTKHVSRMYSFAAVLYLQFVLHVMLFRTLTLRRLMSYIYGAPILDVSRSHTTTQHSR